MSDEGLDLLGDPIPAGFGKRGRPQHMPTQEKRRVVIVLLAFGKAEEEIAAALSITQPTLKKHYFRELRSRVEARHRLDAKLLGTLVAEAEKGNVSAVDRLFKRLDRHDLMQVQGRQPKGKPAKLGKKEKRLVEAATAHEDNSWGELLEQPAPAPATKPN